MSKEDKFTPPKPNKGDSAHLTARAAISSIPFVGGAALEFFNALVSPSLEKRRQRWMEEIADALRKLEAQKGVSLDQLRDNQQFVTIVMQASQAAIRNHQEEKLQALRNAILNSALPNPLEESLQIMFLNFIDAFTVWHIKILYLFQDPTRWAKEHNHKLPDYSSGALSHILEAAFPELENRREFYDQVWRDLVARGLVTTDSLHGMMTGSGLMAQRTSEIGNQFLRFISEPK